MNGPTPHYGPVPPPRKKSRAGLVIGLVTVAVVLVCLCGGVAMILVGGSSGTVDGSTTDGSITDTAKTAKVGEPARDGKFEFTVTKVDQSGKTQVGGDSFGDDAQGEFVFVHITVKNIGDEAQQFFGDNQKMFSVDGKEYSADTEAAIWLKDSKSLYEEINPGNTVRGVVVFDVPKGTKLVRLELHDSSFSNGVVVKL